MKEKNIVEKLKKSALFAGINDNDIESCLKSGEAKIVPYDKDEIIFHEGDDPKNILVLIEGSISICSDFSNGKRSIAAVFSQTGELFGEVFSFLKNKKYEHYAQALTKVKVLKINKKFLYESLGSSGDYHRQLNSNMLFILAQKNYYLNSRLQILSCLGLMQKISMFLLRNMNPDGTVLIGMNREELADWLNTARPSLSRELMRMQKENLIKVKGKNMIYIPDSSLLEDII